MGKIYLFSALLLLTMGASCSLNNAPATNNEQSNNQGQETSLAGDINAVVDNNLVGGDAVNPDNSVDNNGKIAAVVKEFTVHAGNFKFDVNQIKVNKDDRVKINFINDEGFHDWVIDEFNARTKQIKAGESEVIEFVANQAGTFEYYCSVGSHRQMGMVGKLIVE